MDDLKKVVQEAEAFYKEYIQKDSSYSYHNIDHTQLVVNAVEEIGKAEGLSEYEIDLVTIAAWFHDIAYVDFPKEHESKGAEIAENFLKTKLSQDEIDRIKALIMVTKMPQDPQNHMEMVMCDADLSHLGKEGYFQRAENLRKECCTHFKKVNKKEWTMLNIQFLMTHKYFTDYAKKNFQPQKDEYVKYMIENFDQLKKSGKSKKKSAENSNDDKPRRDVETMYRIVMRNHTTFSVIADRKANILLSINSIIVSFAVGVLFRKVEEWPEILVPSVIFALTGLITVILTVIATRPNVTKGKFTKEDIEQDRVNLLFFGNFHGMSLDEYQHALEYNTQTPKQIYDSLSRDLYYLGKVLNLKYKRLHVAFNFFMFGLTLTVVSFIIFFFLLK
ncbi:Pycsar system effector family protein [Aureibacter tunicatorum]|uniref:Metal-dependent HD superfamily phosphohydrolase n=1 Tax=Aureibacter tunicatorum TaxID=866807 RepID=A0AAE3XQM9_9BACT|nr:Pycsar system effector family protein [Aureibacter tunicatorum]MDR6240254.1 putative metal-dependent HD superfamily phosphohydrolase [Aureibacter tunicatorum]BDD05865.1 hypothetical protein AUTU_33480 [Aureibacter tunicatorum]